MAQSKVKAKAPAKPKAKTVEKPKAKVEAEVEATETKTKEAPMTFGPLGLKVVKLRSVDINGQILQEVTLPDGTTTLVGEEDKHLLHR